MSEKEEKSKKTTDNTLNIKTESVQEKFDDTYKKILIKQEEEATKATANFFGYEYIDLHSFAISSESLKSIPEYDCKKYGIICFYRAFQEMRIGITEFNDNVIDYINALDTGEFNTKKKIYFISKGSLSACLLLYSRLPIIKISDYGIKIEQETFTKFKKELKTFEDINKKMQIVDLSDMITLILAAAIEFGSSDIHIEAEEERVLFRIRIDGMLQEIATLKKSSWSKLISRIKLLAGLKINITNTPQDGRITVVLDEDKIDIRVSTLPTIFGESVVMRLLRSSAISVEFEELGLEGNAFERLKNSVEKTNGMIITTGPTGSGKTTTLYAIINKLNKPDVNIITLEDPIEYKLKGINQSQVDHDKNYDFATGLRSILRQDPNVIVIGEIRDKETAEIAVESALTGHKVISTIHTNSASAAIPRFLVMGVKPFLLAPALNAVMGQRLVRRVCKKCKEEYVLEDRLLEKVKNIISEMPEKERQAIDIENLHFYKGKGCETCHGTGYKGRIGIYEILDMCPEIEELILTEKVSEYEIEKIAIKNGMLKMVQDGVLKALNGVTTVEEVFRVID